MDKIIGKNHDQIFKFFRDLERMLEKVEQMTTNYRPQFNGEFYLSDKELAERLKVSRRTLLDYRNDGRLPYYQLGGKILYCESEIQAILEKTHIKSYK